MPCRAYFADADGRRSRARALAATEGERWTVRVEAREPTDELARRHAARDDDHPVARSASSWWRGVAALLAPGGMLLLHDYGFAEPLRRTSTTYAGAAARCPPFVDAGLPPGATAASRAASSASSGTRQARRPGDERRQLRRARRRRSRASGTVLTSRTAARSWTSGRPLERGAGRVPRRVRAARAAATTSRCPARAAAARPGQCATTTPASTWAGTRALFLDLVYVKRVSRGRRGRSRQPSSFWNSPMSTTTGSKPRRGEELGAARAVGGDEHASRRRGRPRSRRTARERRGSAGRGAGRARAAGSRRTCRRGAR